MKNQLLNHAYKVFVYLLMIVTINYREFALVGAIETVVIDLSMCLLYLPSLMSPKEMGNLTMATEAFIESDLSLYSIPVRGITVLILSQTLDGRQAFGANTVLHVVEANVQIIIEHRGSQEGDDNQAIFLLEDRVRMRLTEDWTEIRAMLMQLDPIFFYHLNNIEINPKNPSDDFEVYADKKSPAPSGGPHDVLMVYVVLGAGICMLLLTLLIAYRLTRSIPKNGSDHEEISKRQHCPAKVESEIKQRALSLTSISRNLFPAGQVRHPHKEAVGKASSTDTSSSISIKSGSSQELMSRKCIAEATSQKRSRGKANRIAVPVTTVTNQVPKPPVTIHQFRSPHTDQCPNLVSSLVRDTHTQTRILTDKGISIDASSLPSIKSGPLQELMAQKHIAEATLQESLRGIAKQLVFEEAMATDHVPKRTTKSRQTRPASNNHKTQPLKTSDRKVNRNKILTKQEPRLLDKEIATWPRKDEMSTGVPAHTQHQERRTPTLPGNGANLTQTSRSSSNHHSPHKRNSNPNKFNKGVPRGNAEAIIVATRTKPQPPRSETIVRVRTNDAGVSMCPIGKFTKDRNDGGSRIVTNDEEVPPMWPVVKHTNDHDSCSVSTLTGLGSIFSAATTEYLAGFKEFSGDQSIRSELMLNTPQQPYTITEGDEDRDFKTFQVDYDATDDFGSVAASCPEVNDCTCPEVDDFV